MSPLPALLAALIAAAPATTPGVAAGRAPDGMAPLVPAADARVPARGAIAALPGTAALPAAASRSWGLGLWSAARTGGAPTAQPRAIKMSAADRAATRALLRAEYALARTEIAHEAAAVAAGATLARRLRRECAGVAHGAPRLPGGGFGGFVPSGLSGRRLGEARRQVHEQGSLSTELELALADAREAPDRTAVLAYAHKLAALRWTSAAITALEHANAAAIEAERRLPAPRVCPDLRAWARSGFRALAPRTKALIAKSEALVRTELEAAASRGGAQAEELLERFERHVGAPLVRKLERLRFRLAPAGRRDFNQELRLRAALGLDRAAQAEQLERPPRRAVIVARGRTAAGGSYTLYVPPRSVAPHARSARCPIPLTVEEEGLRRARRGKAVFFHGDDFCAKRPHRRAPGLHCTEGLLVVAGPVLGAARFVRLAPRHGRALVSPVARIPRRAGGPAGFYYQVLPGSLAPVRISLSELDAHGRVLLRTTRAYRSRCAYREPAVTGGPFGPQTTRTLATGQAPGGPRFTITGSRYGPNAHPPLELTAEVEGESLFPFGGASATFQALGEPEETFGAPSPPSGPSAPQGPPAPASPPALFRPQMQVGCSPREYAILYGILTDAGDTVLARTAAGFVPLARVPFPAALHTSGDLAYVATAGVPTELIVQDAAGATVAHEDLGTIAREAHETCEAEAEPAS